MLVSIQTVHTNMHYYFRLATHVTFTFIFADHFIVSGLDLALTKATTKNLRFACHHEKSLNERSVMKLILLLSLK